MPPASLTGHEVIVIGGGPAGLAAGMHLSRAGYRTLLMEKNQLGGQARRIERIENYPGFPAGIRGRDLMALCLVQARRWGLEILQARAASVVRRGRRFRVSRSGGPPLVCRAVLCCAGAQFKRLGIPGEDRFFGDGVYHAAFEEAPRFRGKSVAVVGGGEAALHQALLLAGFARRVYLFSRGPDVKAHRLLKRRMADSPNIIHVPNTAVDGIEGPGGVRRIEVRNVLSGRRKKVGISGLFVLIGQEKTSVLPNGNGKWPGYFVAGDATGEMCRQVAVAAGKGMEAAMACIRYLEGGGRAAHENT